MEYAGSGPHPMKSGDRVSLQCCGKGIYLKPRGGGIQLPSATKTEPEIQGEPRSMDVNIGITTQILLNKTYLLKKIFSI